MPQPVSKFVLPEGCLTVPQAAKRLGMTENTLRSWIGKGRLHLTVIPGSHKVKVIEQKVLEGFARRNGKILQPLARVSKS